MNILIKILPHHLPGFARQQILAQLFKTSAVAFEQPLPELDGLSYEEYLRAYALFTREQAEKALQTGESLVFLKNKFYQNAYSLGIKLRKWFAVHTTEEVMELGQILYRSIGVEIQGNSQGDVIVTGCYFCQFYSGAVCDLISAMDDGVFSGLSGGGRLVFLERLTEGRPYCRAKLNVGSN